MAQELVTDEPWEIIEPLLAPEPPKPEGGRPRVENRAALTGIIFVLKSAIPWEMLPQEMGCGSGVTCWRRLREWQEAGGVWERLHQVLLDRLGEADQIEWEREFGQRERFGYRGAAETAGNVTDKGKGESERKIVAHRKGEKKDVMLTA